MSIFARPVSELYIPLEEGHKIIDAEPNQKYSDWCYSVGYVVDEKDQAVPAGGNTAIFRILPEGMTEPVYVTKSQHTARFTVSTLRGTGKLIRSFSSGAVETANLEEGAQITIIPGQAYSYVNTGESDLLLLDTAMPAFQEGDDIELTESIMPSETIRQKESLGHLFNERRSVILPAKFYALVGEAAAGRTSS